MKESNMVGVVDLVIAVFDFRYAGIGIYLLAILSGSTV
jgi:hypothetical protein